MNHSLKTFVYKRDGRRENIHLDKITSRIQKLCYGLNMDFVIPLEITRKVLDGLYAGVRTVELDILAAETAAMLITEHPDYGILAARIAVSNLHKETKKQFSDVMTDLYKGGKTLETDGPAPVPLLSKYHYDVIMANAERLNSCIVYDRDYGYTYFGFKTLERSYLMRINGKVVERPQHLLMRVAIGIHGDDIDAAIETYDLLSERYFTHASPTLFAAAKPLPQLSSCFLLSVPDDSIEGIATSWAQCAEISKHAGGIGLHIHNVRSNGSPIRSSNSQSRGIVPMLRTFNAIARYVDQGGNKRPGAFAIYLEPWHADIFDFVNLRKNTGLEDRRTRDLFLALWTPDLFMKRVKTDGVWSLMCPDQCRGLADCWGDAFETLYVQYEQEKRFKEQIPARKLWMAICMAQMETGMPYMLYKDSCNAKSNQQNLGTIKSSNLCAEIVQYTSAEEVAVCNLASIAVNMFVRPDRTGFDFDKLRAVTRVVARNLNKIIDVNHYVLEEARTSNKRHRPMGIGVQGLADAFIMLRMPFGSEASRKLNVQIFETIYYGALEASCELAEKDGPYETYEGSPASRGLLQFDLWHQHHQQRVASAAVKDSNGGITENTTNDHSIMPTTGLWNWDSLKQRIAKYGIRNSLLVAAMPTASTSQILGNNESTEPYTSNVYTRRTIAGEFLVVNNHLLKDLTSLGLWNDSMKHKIISSYGSVQHIEEIPEDIRKIYKTVWEMPQQIIVEMALDRAPFIDQSQSLNIHMAAPSVKKLSAMHFFGWERGIKTGLYYLRTQPAANPIQFTLDKSKLNGSIQLVTASQNADTSKS